MLSIELYEHQLQAIEKMHNGCILVGGVGTGKSRTSLAYWFIKVCKGQIMINGEGSLEPFEEPRDLFIITTAKKRDDREWVDEASIFGVSDENTNNYGNVKLTVDSWNNIKKYTEVSGAFFIFDEQRVIGYGAWTKSFLKIAKRNKWILLSATPGDTWSDYMPVFIANGFYKNKTDFSITHCVYSRYTKYPKIDHYINIGQLIHERNSILVQMRFEKNTIPHELHIITAFDKEKYLRVFRDRWDVFDNVPVEEPGKLCYLLRKVVNSDPTRIQATIDILEDHPRVIIFYNYNYELEALQSALTLENIEFAEWNGNLHQEVPKSDRWAYLVQYTAGCEGWNCITTDTIIFYSQSYSYRQMIQAAGRIDRLNTPYIDLYYYHLKSSSSIDRAITQALSKKKNFNERSFLGR